LAALERDAAAQRGVAVHDDEPAVGRGGAVLAGAAVHHDEAAHHVFREARARVAVHAHGRELVHAGAVVADVPVDVDLDLGVDAAGHGVRATRVAHPDLGTARAGEVVQVLVERAQRRLGEVEGRDCGAHATRSRSQTYTRAGSGSQERAPSAPGSTAIARYSEAIATHSSVSAITAGLQAIGSRMTAKPSRVPTAKV